MDTKPIKINPGTFIELVDRTHKMWLNSKNRSLQDLLTEDPKMQSLVKPIEAAVLSQCCVSRN